MHEIICPEGLPFMVETHRIYGGVEANSAAKLEAVREGFFRTVDAHGYSVYGVGLNAFSECSAAEPVSVDRRIVKTGFFSSSWQR